MLWIRISLVALLASCASAGSDDNNPPAPDAEGGFNFPDAASFPDATPTPDAAIVYDAAPVTSDAGLFCENSNTCDTGQCCLSLGGPGFCVPGSEIVPGVCIPN